MGKIVDLLRAWGPFGTLLIAVLDGAGIPLPAGVDALLVATSVANPSVAVLTAALAVVGSTLGCIALYWIARKGGRMYLEKRTQGPRASRFREWFSRYGLLTVFVPAVVPIVPLPLKVFVLSAGAMGVAPLPFTMVVLTARVIRFFSLAWLAAHFGDATLPWLKSHLWQLIAGAALLFAALYALVRARTKPPRAGAH